MSQRKFFGLMQNEYRLDGPDTPSCKTGKFCHNSRKLARRHLKKFRGATGDKEQHTLGIYRCFTCGYLHVGHSAWRA